MDWITVYKKSYKVAKDTMAKYPQTDITSVIQCSYKKHGVVFQDASEIDAPELCKMLVLQTYYDVLRCFHIDVEVENRSDVEADRYFISAMDRRFIAHEMGEYTSPSLSECEYMELVKLYGLK